MFPLDRLAASLPIIRGWYHRQLPDETNKLSERTRAAVENTINLLCEKAGMQKKIKIFESALIDSPISYGCFLWQPTIVISSKESKNNVSDRSLTTYLAHHIYHLKSNDFLITPLFFCLIGLTTMIALNILLPSLAISLPFSTLLAAEIGGGIAGMSATGLLRIWQENRAWNNADLLINS